jgi:hypothetical protein
MTSSSSSIKGLPDSNNNSSFDSLPQNIKDIIAALKDAIDQFDLFFKKARDLILELATRLDEGGLYERNQISRIIKKILKHKTKERKITEKWIEECLPSEYKRPYVKSELSSLSRERSKGQPSNKTESVDKHQAELAELPLKHEVAVLTFGQEEVVELPPPTTKGTDYDDKGKEVKAKSSRRDFTECEDCQIKDSKIKELEDIVRKRTQFTFANQISESTDDKIKQLQKELDERTREVTDRTLQIGRLSDELKHIKEKQEADVHKKDENLNFANVAVTNTGDFEYALLLGDIKYHLAPLYPKIGDGGKVWFSGKFDKDTGNFLSIRFGRIGDNV